MKRAGCSNGTSRLLQSVLCCCALAAVSLFTIHGASTFDHKPLVSIGMYTAGDSRGEKAPLGREESPRFRIDVKLLAYYYPQYHAIPENDEFW